MGEGYWILLGFETVQAVTLQLSKSMRKGKFFLTVGLIVSCYLDLH